jgi:hypothetical protein
MRNINDFSLQAAHDCVNSKSYQEQVEQGRSNAFVCDRTKETFPHPAPRDGTQRPDVQYPQPFTVKCDPFVDKKLVIGSECPDGYTLTNSHYVGNEGGQVVECLGIINDAVATYTFGYELIYCK